MPLVARTLRIRAAKLIGQVRRVNIHYTFLDSLSTVLIKESNKNPINVQEKR